MGKTTSFAATALLATAFVIGTSNQAFAAGQHNPVDSVSNPTALDYTNVEIAPRDMDRPFVRDGIVIEPQLFTRITRGLEQAKVQAALGVPLRQQGQEWDYNFKLKMRQSENFLVCQYKVVYDENHLVHETVWRRQQCQQLANSKSDRE